MHAMRTHFRWKIILGLSTLTNGLVPAAHAQWLPENTMQSRIQNGLYNIGQLAGFIPPSGLRTFPQILGAYTNGLLTLLGLLFLIMIIRGGLIWMTAGGEEEKARQAKLIIKNSVYGLAIVLLARIFTGFYLNFLAPAVTTP